MKLSSIISEVEMARLAELDAPMLGTPQAGAAPAVAPAADPAAQAKLAAQQVKQQSL